MAAILICVTLLIVLTLMFGGWGVVLTALIFLAAWTAGEARDEARGRCGAEVVRIDTGFLSEGWLCPRPDGTFERVG